MVLLVLLVLLFVAAVAAAITIAASTSKNVVHLRHVIGNDAHQVVKSLHDLISSNTK